MALGTALAVASVPNMAVLRTPLPRPVTGGRRCRHARVRAHGRGGADRNHPLVGTEFALVV